MARAAPSVSGRRGDRVATSGSEIEALLREALLIRDLQPVVNVQTAAPTLATRAIPRSLVQDVVLLVPSIDPDAAELVAARDDGATMLHRSPRNGAELARHSRELWRFFTRRSDAAGDRLAPLVFSWLAGRGLHTTRLNPRDFASARHLRVLLGHLLADRGLFSERLIAVARRDSCDVGTTHVISTRIPRGSGQRFEDTGGVTCRGGPSIRMSGKRVGEETAQGYSRPHQV